jgi:RNA polymerase sigma factor (TIGR02999 family)
MNMDAADDIAPVDVHWTDIQVMSAPASPTPDGEITRLLSELRTGKAGSESELMDLLYDELRALARRQMRREAVGHTLQTTALVHEAYLRLFDKGTIDWNSRTHFFAVAGQVMRRVLVDHARGRRAAKRGGDAQRVELTDLSGSQSLPIDQILAVDEALTELGKKEPRQARMVELHLFAGLTLQETAEVLGVCVRTVKRDWEFAQAWLYRQMQK